MLQQQNAAQALVAGLKAQDIRLITCVPGESYLAVLDALYDAREDIRLITCRQESGAALMAEAMARLNGGVGVCFVTRGPGATNASIGVHVAYQNSTPFILFTGQVGRDKRGREAAQEVDFEAMFAPLAKAAFEVGDPADMVDVVAQAFQIAQSGRPGPVVVSLPEDVTRGPCPKAYRKLPLETPRIDPAALAEIGKRLEKAARPVLVLGGSTWDADSTAAIQELAEKFDIPVAVGFRRQDLIDHRSPAYAGVLGLGPDPALVAKVKQADLVLAIGSKLNDIVTQNYTLFPNPGQTLIHVYPEASELGRVFQPQCAVAAAAKDFVAALSGTRMGDVPAARHDWARACRQAYEAFTAQEGPRRDLNLDGVFKTLRRMLPDGAVVTNGAGNFAIWLHRYFPCRQFRTQLSPVNGAMGYGLPAALAAKLLDPARPAICVTGDGDFMMTAQEMATAQQYGLKPVILLINNSRYGTIRMHQERSFPGRVSGTDLVNPDFVALAKAFGFEAMTVARDADVAPALETALAAKSGALIELRVDPDLIAPTATTEDLRKAAK